ncbi:hypothetical protein [Halomicrococcus sp. SG-WS-1]|uniref:hypothetical protein n=1 Tax=Halomicrococcus sp. SG-WS-1 TaxID=3439057 RepID=UPI003F79324A
MNSTRCSRLATLVVAAALVLSAVAPAAAISVSKDGVPGEAKVGSEVSGSVTLTELYGDYEQWTLRGETELKDVTWTVTTFDQAGNQKSKQSYDGQSFNHSLSLDSGVSEVKLTVKGTVPEVESYTYDSRPAFTFAELTQVRQGGNSNTFRTVSVDHYTEKSKQARNAIGDAEQAIDDAPSGADTADAESSLDDAVTAYKAGNFQLATDLAGKAEESANTAAKEAQQSQQRTTLLMYGGVAVVLLLVVGGGVYWYRSQQQNTSKLR